MRAAPRALSSRYFQCCLGGLRRKCHGQDCAWCGVVWCRVCCSSRGVACSGIDSVCVWFFFSNKLIGLHASSGGHCVRIHTDREQSKRRANDILTTYL